MMHEAFVRAVQAERARERDLALLVHQVTEHEQDLEVRTRRRGVFRLAELVRFVLSHRRQPRNLAAADLADRTFAG